MLIRKDNFVPEDEMLAERGAQPSTLHNSRWRRQSGLYPHAIITRTT